MSVADKLLARVDALLVKGQRVVATKYNHGAGDAVDYELCQEWRTQSLSALSAIVGKSHTYAVEFGSHVTSNWYSDIQAGMGILRALREDIANGHLASVETIVSAEVFSDFLGMAHHLLNAGYKDPCASVVGAVLEDGLRKIATNAGVAIGPKDFLAALNEKCAKAQVYNALAFKQVAVWTEIRNKADHGKFTEYTESDVRAMLTGVQDFLAKHLV